ncbi:MAG: GGDEF domain-containing protein [endosymbiont of Seepiophila jonesi]|uniref:GGDEF domain-containing protein n=1 Tax=endosymbiont of Lamellibrachia luymesi TaxID=2200907 RepID=A0A370DXN5_9GAMM|nr:MAG: GGDEF domain-containing protein [endosymbiont of Lamellibrachia luymesi]RDH94103.1 MAG: GGDEF domain-containing protein [endosymbiont of Seepiophila jonesi]
MPDPAIEILIIGNAMTEVESYISSLRNSGVTVHANRLNQDDKRIAKEIRSASSLDMVIYTAESGDIGIEHLMSLLQKYGVAVPVIALSDPGNEDFIVYAINQGVKNVVARKNSEHLTLAVKREFSSLLARRKLEKTQSQLKEADARCHTLIQSSREAIAYIHEGMHVEANPAYLQMFGQVEQEEIEGLPILDMIAPSEHKKFKKILRSLSADHEQTAEIEVSCLRDDEKEFSAQLSFSPASIDGEPCTQLVIRDQTNDRQLEDKLRLLSTQDSHTGLYNRQHFLSILEETTSQQQDQDSPTHSLLYITLDNFQEIRNSAGIAASDSVLNEVADILTGLTHTDDLLARFGDHTFTLLTPLADRQEVESLAVRICTEIDAREYTETASYISPTSSVGIAFSSPEIAGGQEFLNLAYHACENARQQGGNQFFVSIATTQQEEEDEAGNETDLSHLIQHALENDQFKLVYQPIISLQGDTRENYAVLVRLIDHNNEEIQPNYFLKQTDEMGKMAAVDRWVIRHAIAELSAQRKNGRKINFFINISGTTLEDDTLLLWICDCLREFEAKGPWVIFQISDSDARAHLQQVQKLTEGLQKIKCQLSIDHFGLTPKPETLLRNLPVNYIQFDPKFLDDLAGNQEKQDALNEANRIGQSYNVKTVATGIEDASSLAILWSIGANYIRGYFLQEPSPTISYDFKQS